MRGKREFNFYNFQKEFLARATWNLHSVTEMKQFSNYTRQCETFIEYGFSKGFTANSVWLRIC
jgi:hypothetical protein